MEPVNPYFPTETNLDTDAPQPSGPEIAARRTRLFAAIMDSIFMMLFMIPGFVHIGWETLKNPELNQSWSIRLILLGCMIPPFLINCLMVKARGQTVGKWFGEIRMVRMDGSPLTLGRYLTHRIIPFYAFAQIPVVGSIGLLDYLWIFGKEKRCLHDLAADTKVIKI